MATEKPREYTADWGIDVVALHMGRGKGLKPSEQVFQTVSETLGLVTETHGVMPRHKTADDKCGKCFIIHSEGQEDCW